MSGIMSAMSGGKAPIVVTCSPIIYGSGSNAIVTTSPADGAATGGSGSYSWSWSYLSGDIFTVVSSTSPTSTFRSSGMLLGDSRDGFYRLTATDTVDGSTGFIDVEINTVRF